MWLAFLTQFIHSALILKSCTAALSLTHATLGQEEEWSDTTVPSQGWKPWSQTAEILSTWDVLILTWIKRYQLQIFLSNFLFCSDMQTFLHMQWLWEDIPVTMQKKKKIELLSGSGYLSLLRRMMQWLRFQCVHLEDLLSILLLLPASVTILLPM